MANDIEQKLNGAVDTTTRLLGDLFGKATESGAIASLMAAREGGLMAGRKVVRENLSMLNPQTANAQTPNQQANNVTNLVPNHFANSDMPGQNNSPSQSNAFKPAPKPTR